MNAPKEERNRSWQWALNTVVTVVLSVGGWMLGTARTATVSAAEIAAIKERQAEQDKKIDQKLSTETFHQFTKGLDERLQLIQTNTELLVKMQKKDRK